MLCADILGGVTGALLCGLSGYVAIWPGSFAEVSAVICRPGV